MKKIAFIIHRLSGNGAENVTIRLANELAKRGYKITIFVRESTEKVLNDLSKKIDVIDLNNDSKNKLVKNVISIFKIRKIFKDDYDVIFAVTFSMGLLASFTNKLMGRKRNLIVVMHNTISQEKISLFGLKRKIFECSLNSIERIVFVSKGAENDFTNIFNVDKSKLLTIYNPVINADVVKKSKIICDHKWLQNDRRYKTIVTIGRLTDQKNHELLINAFNDLRQKDVKLIILGEGELRGKIEEQIHMLKLDDRVDVHGFVDNPYSYLSSADLFVLSSNYEGLPTVLIEALACGCKAVSTNCPTGPEEILESGRYGILVSINDKKALTDAIEKSLSDEAFDKDVLIKRGREFNVENSVNRYEQLINDVINC